MTRLLVNGIHLNVEVSGPADATALMLLHGFTGDATTWEPFLDAWLSIQTIRVDLIGPGRSDSPADPARYAMAHAVQALLAVLDPLGVERAAVLGYSMGGRVALHLSIAAPERSSALIVESASPGIEDDAQRAARRASDEALAADIEHDGVAAFVDRWQAQPLFASQA